MSPLGAAALGTSSFPVNRPRLAELLGFDGLVENSLDANQISPIDTGAELATVAAAGALTVNTLLADITAQYAQTKPWLVLAEGNLTGISSIMPQKRNPTGMVDVRIQASKVIGAAQTFLVLAHNVPSGMGDYKGDQPNIVLRDASRMFESFAALMKTSCSRSARLPRSTPTIRPRRNSPTFCSASPTCLSASAITSRPISSITVAATT
jgi:argininosuccinate lyase